MIITKLLSIGVAMFFTGTQENVSLAEAQISYNCQLPFMNTLRWAVPQASYSDQTFWFIEMPPSEGWTREDGVHFTQEKMIEGVVNVEIQESQPDWWPPSPFPPEE